MSEDNYKEESKLIRRRRPLLSRRALLIILICISQLALLFAVFGVGYKIGQDVGRKDATVQAGLSGFNSLLGNISNPFRSATGKVSEVSAGSITIKTNSGETKTMKITSNTKITRRSEPISVADIKKDVRASIFLDESVSELTASRIIVNE